MKWGVLMFVIIALLGNGSTAAAQVSQSGSRASIAAPPSAEVQERNKALARRFYEQVWFSHNLSAVDELVAPTYVVHDIGDRKAVTEPADEQKKTADFFWQRGTMSGTIDYQIAEGDLVATRWQWNFRPSSWWMRMLGGRNPIPIINVFRIHDGKIVEFWNHRHDIDTGLANLKFVVGLFVGLVPSLISSVVSFLLWRKLRKLRTAAKTRAAIAS
jgi:predicted SnoaL-like aldol condensation-catalyzing enzyme